MKRLLYLVILLLLVGMACKLPFMESEETQTAETVEEPQAQVTQPGQVPQDAHGEQVKPQNQNQESEKRCGDGICAGPETVQNCPADCSGEQVDANKPELPAEGERPQVGSSAAIEEYTVTNPTSGGDLWVLLARPQDGEGPYPVMVLVPGGIGSGSSFLEKGMVDRLAADGIMPVIFDPDGRGKSGGVEDYDGFIQQDGMAAVIEFAASQADADVSSIGVMSFSYGVTLASGVLARYPDLPVAFFIDWEGPVDRNYTTVGCTNGTKIDFNDCSDDAYWSEREAVNFIVDVRVPYLRLQGEKDHVQPDNTHAIDIVNAAVAGSPPWVRLNDYPPNETYDADYPPVMLGEAENASRPQVASRYIWEMIDLYGGQ